MALGALYPAEIIDGNQNVSKGVDIQFTDDGNQPAAGNDPAQDLTVGALTVAPVSDPAADYIGITVRRPAQADGMLAFEVVDEDGTTVVASLDAAHAPHLNLFNSVDLDNRSDMDPGRLQLVSGTETNIINLSIQLADGQTAPAVGVVDINGDPVASIDAAGVLAGTAVHVANVGTDPATPLGFYGATAVVRPVVPLTTPTVQDVIDALVSLGLVSQSD